MFNWLNKQGVEKSGEFFLQRVDRFHYEYGEGSQRIKIVVEPSAKAEQIYISDAIAPLSELEGKRIADNVAEALRFMGLHFNVR